MVNAFTCPSSSEATAFPLLVTPDLFVPVVLNVNDPVGFGGFNTFNASRRISVPNLIVCRPRTIENVSRYSVTEVVNFEFAADVGPICWNPVTAKVGNTEG